MPSRLSVLFKLQLLYVHIFPMHDQLLRWRMSITGMAMEKEVRETNKRQMNGYQLGNFPLIFRICVSHTSIWIKSSQHFLLFFVVEANVWKDGLCNEFTFCFDQFPHLHSVWLAGWNAGCTYPHWSQWMQYYKVRHRLWPLYFRWFIVGCWTYSRHVSFIRSIIWNLAES